MAVQGKSITLPSGSGAWAAIDTGTTGIGMPSDIIASIFAQVPGAQKATGQFDGYWTYRAYLFSRPQPLITSVLIITSPRLHQLTHPSTFLCHFVYFRSTSRYIFRLLPRCIATPRTSLRRAALPRRLHCPRDLFLVSPYRTSRRLSTIFEQQQLVPRT